ncbi:MAG: DUF4269 domain-containing protein [Flavobacterium sp.]
MDDFSTIEYLKNGNQKQILTSKDENFRLEIIKLKQKAYKTEPAFGLLLGLKNDPYLELLHYKIDSNR